MNAPLVDMTGITKHFGALAANRAVNLRVAPGTVHAVVGENGAGKSTLLRILAGVLRPDSGEVRVGGKRLPPGDPRAAIAQGVGMIHQHFMLVETLTVAENLVLGQEPLRHGLLDRREARRAVLELVETWGLSVHPDALIRDLSVGERQRVEILKVLYRGARILVMDEPTAVLSPREVDRLLGTLRRFVATEAAHRDGGAPCVEASRAVILVTHKLDEVMAAADRVSVMRRGELVADLDTRGTDPKALAHLMVGRDVDLEGGRLPGNACDGAILLEIQDLCLVRGKIPILDGVSLKVHGGEILGVAGVMGNGQTELLEAVAGLTETTRGRILLEGRDITGLGVAERLTHGLGHIPEDRNDRGLVLDMSVQENLVLGRQRSFGNALRLDGRGMGDHATRLVSSYDIRPPGPDEPVGTLSGGNAQKVVVAREVSGSPRVLLAGQPTRGVDVGAVEAIHARLRDLRTAGIAILLVSADLKEILDLSDRIIVLHRGRVTGEFAAGTVSAEILGERMSGLGGEP